MEREDDPQDPPVDEITTRLGPGAVQHKSTSQKPLTDHGGKTLSSLPGSLQPPGPVPSNRKRRRTESAVEVGLETQDVLGTPKPHDDVHPT